MLLKVTLVHTFDGITVENTFGLESADGTDPQDVADAVGALFAASAWMDGRSDHMGLAEVRVEDDTPGTAASGSFLFDPQPAGDDAGNAAPATCAVVVKWRATGKGKAGRGRMYLTGYPASTAISGFWTSDALNPASAAASVIFDAYGPSGSGQLCIINRFAGGVELAPHTGNLVKSFVVDNVIRQQRRREQGVGS